MDERALLCNGSFVTGVDNLESCFLRLSLFPSCGLRLVESFAEREETEMPGMKSKVTKLVQCEVC